MNPTSSTLLYFTAVNTLYVVEGCEHPAAAKLLIRVPDDRQGAQAEEVHFQQAQLFDLGHIELGDRQAVVGGQGQIIVCRFRGNDDAATRYYTTEGTWF